MVMMMVVVMVMMHATSICSRHGERHGGESGEDESELLHNCLPCVRRLDQRGNNAECISVEQGKYSEQLFSLVPFEQRLDNRW